MLTRLHARVRADRDDAGMTLTEVLVGMTLLSIVGALATGFFVSMAKQTSRTTGEDLSAGDVRSAMNQVVSALRYADTPTAQAGYATSRFTVLSPSEATFFSNLSAGVRSGTATRTPPAKIDITATGTKLIEQVYAPITAYTTYPANYNWATNYPASPTTTTVLLSSLANTSVFTYCTDATDPTVSCTPASAGESVSSVLVTLTVSGLAGESAQTLKSAVAITGALT